MESGGKEKIGMEHRPVILTRPLADAQCLAEQIRQTDPTLDVHLAPLIAVQPVPHCIDTIANCAGLILTSANAVRSLDPAAAVVGMTAWCVGPRTGAAGRQRGLDVRVAGGSANDLIELLLADRPVGELLYIRGTHIAAPLADRLKESGIRIRDIITYDQPEVPLPSAIRTMMDERSCLVSLHSARTARIFVRQASHLQNQDHLLLCQSAAIATAVGPGWTTHHVDDDTDVLLTIRTLAQNPR